MPIGCNYSSLYKHENEKNPFKYKIQKVIYLSKETCIFIWVSVPLGLVRWWALDFSLSLNIHMSAPSYRGSRPIPSGPSVALGSCLCSLLDYALLVLSLFLLNQNALIGQLVNIPTDQEKKKKGQVVELQFNSFCQEQKCTQGSFPFELKLERTGSQPTPLQPSPNWPQEVLLFCAGRMDVETDLFIGPPQEGRHPWNR